MDNDIQLFITELSLASAISLFAIALLRTVLPAILVDLCGNKNRALFWNRFTQLMLLIGPLLSALLLSYQDQNSSTLDARFLRDTLRHALTGLFFSLFAVGAIIWKTIPTANALTIDLDATTNSSREKHQLPAGDEV